LDKWSIEEFRSSKADKNKSLVVLRFSIARLRGPELQNTLKSKHYHTS